MVEHDPKTHPITIHLNKTHGLSVTPNQPVEAEEGDEIEWRMAGGPGHPELIFAVDFCPSNEGSNNGRRSPVPWPKEQKPAKDPVKGKIDFKPNGTQTFHYAIAVWDGKDLYALDPEIRVRPKH